MDYSSLNQTDHFNSKELGIVPNLPKLRVPCRGCAKVTCDEHICMELITPEAVASAARILLNEKYLDSLPISHFLLPIFKWPKR